MIGIDVEKFAQIGESVRRGHCPTRKILPYGRLSDTEFLRDRRARSAVCLPSRSGDKQDVEFFAQEVGRRE